MLDLSERAILRSKANKYVFFKSDELKEELEQAHYDGAIEAFEIFMNKASAFISKLSSYERAVFTVDDFAKWMENKQMV